MSLTKAELAALMKQAANPDTAPLALQTLNDSITSLIDEHATATTALTERDTTIAGLRDTNMKLFLRATGTPPETPAEETPEQEFDRLFTQEALKQLGKQPENPGE